MTREQSEHIQRIEGIVDSLTGYVDFMTAPSNLQKFGPLNFSTKGTALPTEEYCEGVKAFNENLKLVNMV